MEKHAVETCPLCGEPFVCKVNSIQKCDCMKVNLNDETLLFIKNTLNTQIGGYECICINCLKILKKQYEDSVLPL